MYHSLRLNLRTPSKVYTYTTFDHTPIKIGRSLRCEFNAPLEDLSREHCLFEVEDQNYFITDLGSKNGVWVNGEKIDPNVKTKITQKDLVSISNLYQLKINPIEIKTQPVFQTERKNVDREVKTRTIQLEFPDAKQEKALAIRRGKIARSKTSDDEKQASSLNTILIVTGILALMGMVIYHYLEKVN
jgi:pSer/pThr/pTyr-binding forkhead associated (FHA) protein